MSTRSARQFSPDRVASTPGFIPLETIRVASPCNADWDAMQGDDRARFCGSCQKNVYNLSAMTRAEAEALIEAKEGHLCVRYFQRADGTMLTQDCPIGLLQVDKRIKGRLAAAAFISSLMIVCGALVAGAMNVPSSTAVAGEMVVAPTTPSTNNAPARMGDVSVAPKPEAPRAEMGLVAPRLPVPTPTPKATPTPAPDKSKPHPPMVMGKIAIPRPKAPQTQSQTPKTKNTP